MATEMTRPMIKRKQYLVAKRFQLKYVGLILALMFLTAAFCSYVVYYSMMILMGEKLANVYPQGRLMAIVNTVNFRIMLSMFYISPMIIVIGIFLSHKIAGPVFRIERTLNNMAEGDLSAILALRKGDEMTSLADAINRVTESMKAAVAGQKQRVSTAINEINALKQAVSSAPQVPAAVGERVKTLEKEISGIAENLNKYKI